MADKIESFLNKLTTAQTTECAKGALALLSTDDAFLVVQEWIKENDLMDDVAIWCEENTETKEDEGD